MKTLRIAGLLLALATAAWATEARIEAMGNNPDFIKDDMSVFINPATGFDFGNRLMGSLGQVTPDGTGWKRTDQWYGGILQYAVNDNYKLFGCVTLNRTPELFKQYQSLEARDFFTVFAPQIDSLGTVRRYGNNRYLDYLEAVDVNRTLGNAYLFGGVSMAGGLTVALGGRYSGNSYDDGGDNLSDLTIAGGNLGVNYTFDRHRLEASINYNSFSLTRKSVTPKLNLDISGESSTNVFLRMFYQLNNQNKLVPTLYLDKYSLLGISNSDIGVGIGFNRDLHKGFVWAGMKYAYHTAEYPSKIGGLNFYSKDTVDFRGVKENSHKLVYSFGVEKKMLWDWFTLRVGGNKGFEFLTKKKTDAANKEYVIEKSTSERDVDAVGWGISIGTPDDRLMFDITMSEAFPYSSILAGGENGIMISRISAGLNF